MKNLIILEGIASTGKTTIEKLLVERLKDSLIVSENETLMPLIDNKDVKVALVHLKKILDEVASLETSTIILDRFHLTHAFRTNTNMNAFEEVEKSLLDNSNPIIVLLTIGEGVVQSRIIESQKIRGVRWAKGKQGSLEEKVAYYTDQQQKLKQLIIESRLPVLQLDTTEKEWGEYAETIISHLDSQ